MVVGQCAFICRIASVVSVPGRCEIAERQSLADWSVMRCWLGATLLQFSALPPIFCDPHLHRATSAPRGNVPRTKFSSRRAANRACLLVLLISEQLADRTLSCADSLRSIEGDSGSGGPTISLKRPFPARRIDRLDYRVFISLMFHAPSLLCVESTRKQPQIPVTQHRLKSSLNDRHGPP